MAMQCGFCGQRCPPNTPEPYEIDRDGETRFRIAVPAGFVPADQGAPALVCVDCATDAEVNRWILSAAFQQGRR